MQVLINSTKLVYGTKLYRFYQIREKFSLSDGFDIKI